MNNSELLDKFALTAMQALIAKMPLLDRDGDVGEKIEPEKLRQVKQGICETAYEYASYMLIEREKANKWLKENQSNGHLIDQP